MHLGRLAQVGVRADIPPLLRVRPPSLPCPPYSKPHHLYATGSSAMGDKSEVVDDDRSPAAGAQGESVLRREVRAAVDSLSWPPLVSRVWAPLPALTGNDPPPEGRAAGAGDGVGAEGGDKTGEGAILGGEGKRLKVLSWNVLCDGLSGAHPAQGGFLKAPGGSLDWDKRRWKILEEILRWDCDVVVLQEVDHHHDWLSPKLAKEGYRSLFVKKPIAPGITFNPHLEDGCSLFYRTAATAPATAVTQESVRRRATTLDLLDAHSFTLAVVEQDGSNSGDGKEMSGDGGKDQKEGETGPVAGNQVAMISLLSLSTADGVGDGDGDGGNGRETLVIVTTTHLKAAKTAHGEAIRARQAQQLLDEVARFRAGHEQARGLPAGSIPLVVAGDFNATPRTSGEGYEPLCYRRVLRHPLSLRSALPTGEDFFSTWKIRPAKSPPAVAEGEAGAGAEVATRESKHCIDYVWVSDGVRPTLGSTLPSGEELGPSRAPSFVYPSDHFAIAVDLRLP